MDLVKLAAALDSAANDMHTEPQLWLPDSSCDSGCTFGKLQGLVYEVGFTIKNLVVKLDIGRSLLALVWKNGLEANVSRIRRPETRPGQG